MPKRISTLLIAVLALAALGGTTSVATARQGADDPAGHVRRSGADDAKVTATRRAHRRARHARGADDRAGHGRHGRGTDDGPNHS